MKKYIILLFSVIIFIIIIISIAFEPIKDKENEDVSFEANNVIVNNVSDDFITCKEIGMIPDDEAKGETNFGLLKNCLISGKNNILVDASYYLSNTSEESIISV
ncbi:MAG: hypothetical protein K0S55_247, partial [Clostridia bacterium]|nr:hypothetical protein [Clostridia bacterium]